ncbi:radical SAM protein [Clostridium beijerinckii]|uniref:radical SAM protein n=1 Tax=Clostridium beijerinckii TaxID=1520 RepID=UPI00232F4C5B|nr:radical SAM protein [Clostridium beijerinckii]
MFILENFYKEAHSGERVDDKEMINYIKSFKHVIIWGGSYLGSAVGKYLLSKGIVIDKYWDMRAEELKIVNDIEVMLPFSLEDKENTIIIFCIGNNVIRGTLLKKLGENGYSKVIRGDYLYMGLICPFDKTTGIDSKQCQGTMCCRSIFCQRLSNIVKSEQENSLHTFSITFIVNSRCSLGCKCCTSYMNAYPKEKRKDVPLEQICEDIDKFFDAMDSVGTVTVMGGEPFMHPDLSKIIQKLLSKKNFGVVSIATSGTYPIKEEQLEGLNDKRLNISFSNYEQSITENQKKMFYKNVEMVKDAGISYTVGVVMPEWSIPSTLYDLGNSEEIMIRKKRGCIQPPRCMQVKNGKLHPCDFGTAVYSLGIADYEMDYVDIKNSNSKEELKEKIRNYIDQPYYRTCGHCVGLQGLTSKAAEQGFIDFTKPLNL